MQYTTQYAVVEHYPDGNSSIIELFSTKQEAQNYAYIKNRHLLKGFLPLTVQERQVCDITAALRAGKTITL